MPLLEESRQTSRAMFESESEPENSWDVYSNSSKSGIFTKMPFFEESRQTSQEMLVSDSDPKIAWDVYSNSSKSGILQKCVVYIHNTSFGELR